MKLRSATLELQHTVEAIRTLERLALNSPDPQIVNFARAFFDEHGREAFKMVADIRHHSGFTGPQLPELELISNEAPERSRE